MVGTSRHSPSRSGPNALCSKGLIASTPSKHIGIGGIVTRMSSVTAARAALASYRSCASMKRSSSARSSADGSAADHSERCDGRCFCIIARARCSALLAAGTLVSSSAAVSAAGMPEHVTQQQRGPLARWQHLQGGEERQLDRLACHRHHLGLVLVGHQFVEQPVGVRRQPGHLGERVQLLHPPRLAADHVQADVGRDPVEPGPGEVPRPRSVSRARQARSRVSCTASSASSNDASIR